MSHQDWMTLLGPILAALVLGIAGILGAIFTGITARIRSYLDSKGQAAEAAKLASTAGRMQDAMSNAAGQIAMKVQTGELDVTNLAAVKAEAAKQEVAILEKMPTAADILQPVTGAIADGIVGKLGLAAQRVAAILPSAPAGAPVHMVGDPAPAPSAVSDVLGVLSGGRGLGR